VTLRTGGPGDADLVVDTVREGFEGYRAFAPPGWELPDRAVELRRVRERLGDAWLLVAEHEGRRAGHVSLLPDAEEPGGAFLWHLFVAEPWWGTGLAVALHERFLGQARSRGHGRARARTPSGQLRARRFYAREGWREDGPPLPEPRLGMDVVVLRRSL
jgi:GNAT superfamily N-acetyltransferase